ncbi:serine/threonine protein kinase [Gleimia sp. 6138-11-ORH1]|uniref:serine/threonine-protein kinase n=1 Tax=Gleimia sp. 6138-11-ORH1 TaxID=2973937 RepID=UPI0021696466|nr:serine/threonine-protein kinase [Gleimia sp. 6138-11-ORH1]MCS4484780.1 serine/threonine protein kinase [Gleimia sp. 6138-11-ORH1]
MSLQRELLPGDEIGGYQLVRLLGTGGTGKVWEVRDGGGTSYALKLLHPQLSVDETYRKRILREAQLLSKVQSPGVIQVCDVEVDGAEPFVVTELVHGPSLKQYVQTQRALSLVEATQIARELLEILESVHAVGVVHRDVKPANILLGQQGPVLIDFGIAHTLNDDRLTAIGLVSGTPGWVAPEVIDGKHPDKTADLWGWAATFLFMLTGRSPYGAGSWETILARMASGQVDTAGLDSAVANAFQRALGGLSQRPQPRELLAFLDSVASHSSYSSESAAEATNTVAIDFPEGGFATNLPVEGVNLGNTEVLEAGTTLLPTEGTSLLPTAPAEPTAQLPTEGTSLLPTQGLAVPVGGVEIANVVENPIGQTYRRRKIPLITGLLFYLWLGSLPLAFGAGGVVALGVILLVFAYVGIHRSFLRMRYFDQLQLTSKDRAIAIARFPIHLLQVVLGLGLAIVFSQAAMLLVWYLIGLRLGWDGLALYQAIMTRTAYFEPGTYLFPRNQLGYYLGAFFGSGFFTVMTVILGPVGSEFREGTAYIMRDIFKGRLLRFVIVGGLIALSVVGINQSFGLF